MADTREVRVSYVLTTRNRAEFLDRALENVREFITPEDELIVMDGGSTDVTAEVIERHRDIVTIFKSEPDCGEAHGMNRAILASSGRYIKVITDDDYLYPDAMRHAVAVMEEHPDLDALLCGGEYYGLNPDTGTSELSCYRWIPPSCRLASDVTNVLEHTICGVGLLFDRRVIARVGLFDTTFRAVDLEYVARLIACRVNLKYLNIKLFRHIEYPHSGLAKQNEMMRDRLRTTLYHGAWPYLVDRRRYPPLAVGEVLGLKDLPHGDVLMRLIWYGEHLRRSRLHGLLRLAVWCMDAPVRLKRWACRVWRRPEGSSGMVAAPVQPPVEPVWDGSLR